MIAVASDMESLFVYECSSVPGPINCKLIWSTQLPFVPVAFSRANFDGMPGGIVLLSGNGQIIVGFFGTDPQIFKVPPLTTTDENQQDMHKELKRLEGDIKHGIDFTGWLAFIRRRHLIVFTSLLLLFPDVSFINAATDRNLEVTIETAIMPCKPYTMKKFTDLTKNHKMISVQVKMTPRVHLEQLGIAINPPYPLEVNENSTMFMGVEVGKELEAKFEIYVSRTDDPPSLTVPVIFSMITRPGVPRIIEKSVDLSPALILKACLPQKEGHFKLSIDSPSTDILSLFPEFAKDTINQQALGLQSIYSNDTITVVLGKNSSRYRIQSDSLSIFPVVVELLIQRLQKSSAAHSSITATAPGISINPSYYAEELVASIESHLEWRGEVKSSDKAIEKKSRQMRLFQRKLMLMLQQDPPHPAYNSAGKLLRLTHADLTELQGQLLAAVDRWRQSKLRLSNHLRLIKLVIHHSKMPLQIKDNLFAVFVNPINDWVETVRNSLF